jgi:hypothetical protein
MEVWGPCLNGLKKLEFIEASNHPCAEQRNGKKRNRLYVQGII